MKDTKEKTEYKMAFDLDRDGRHCDGSVSFADDRITVLISGQPVISLAIEDTDEFKMTPNIGCAFIECRHKGSDLVLCRLTMDHLTEAGEFCKIMNYYKKEGLLVEDPKKETGKCPKCGRKLMENTTVCFFCIDKLHIFKKAAKLMSDFKKPLLIVAILMVMSNVMSVGTPILSRVLIDGYLRPQAGKIIDILIICAGMLALRAVGEVIFIFSARISNRTSGSIANNLRCSLYAKVQQLSMSSMSKKTSGDLLKRITQDTQKIKNFITDQGRWSFEKVSMFVIIGIILFITNPLLAAMVFIPIPIALIFGNRFMRIIYKKYGRQWRLHSRSNAILHDIIKGIRVVKTFGNEEREIAKFDRSCKVLADVSADNEKYWTKKFSLLCFLIGSSEFLVLYFGGKAVLGHELTIGELVQFTMYLTYIYGPLRWMTQIPRWLADLTTSLVKLFEILDEEPEIMDAADVAAPDIKGAIEFDQVIFGYKAYEPVLKDINISISPGEMIGIVGHSGVGKSTMINLLLRLYDVNSGKITIDGSDIRNISQKALHESIGAVFQETFLFAGSIYDNVAYSKPGAVYEEVIAASKIANSHEFIIKLPDAYNTIIGENGYSLSSGERQRLAIARAVLKKPSILILDEATATLDVETEGKIQEALLRLAEGRTTIAIAHRLSTLRNADRLIVLEKGCLAETGTHKELLMKKGVYYNLVMAQRQTSRIRDDTGQAE